MDSEEFEQIPWAKLVAEQSDGIDKRVYLAVGLVGVFVIALLGMKLVGGGGQPIPPQATVIAPVSTTGPVAAVPTTVGVISEADLMAEAPVGSSSGDRLVEVTAEWFVTDWFTRDGSDETIRSIRAVVSPDVDLGELPHETDDGPVAFVEWASATISEVTSSGIDVTVAYRAIRQVEEGFVRDPVVVVLVSLVRDGDAVTVAALPRTVG